MKKLAIGALLLGAFGQAQAGDVAVGVVGGTLGAGVNISYGLNEHANLRGWFSALEVSAPDIESDGVNYTGDIDIGAQGLLLDYYPFAGKFRISTGIMNNASEVRARGNANNVAIGNGGDSFTGEASADVDLGGVAPYLGIGWGNPVSEGSRFGFGIDIGIVVADPEVDFQLVSGVYTVSGAPQGINIDDPAFAAIRARVDQSIQQEEDNINNNDLDEFDLYPVLNIGVSYRF